MTNATPLAMNICGFFLEYRAELIRWRTRGTFLPAFKALGFAQLSRNYDGEAP